MAPGQPSLATDSLDRTREPASAVVQVQATRQGQFLVLTSLDRRSTVSGPVEKKVLAAGPARDAYRLYAEADRPQLEVLAKTIADDDALPGGRART